MTLTINDVVAAGQAYSNRHKMPSNSSASRTGTMASRKTAFPKTLIDIHIDNHFSSKVYTSGSPISGHVTITPQRDVYFDTFQIVLMGVTKTRVEAVGMPVESTHIFLKMAMPIPQSEYPVPRVFETGVPYTFPFNFVVPYHLTISSCNHATDSGLVHEAHTCLPPTMGDWPKDDLAPDMAQVEYSIKARIFREGENPSVPIKIVEESTPIRILPASAEQPPLNITKEDRAYTMSKTKSVRKKLFSGKVGKVTATAIQPEAVHLTPDGLAISDTTAQVMLNFDPVSPDVTPPKVTAISGKIIATTHYASGPITSFPNLGSTYEMGGVDRRNQFSTSVSLFNTTLDKFKWTQYLTPERRDSGYSSDSQCSDGNNNTNTNNKAASSSSPLCHRATLQVPVKLPLGKKTFIPTFHSCIASRTYALSLSVVVGSGSTATTLTVTVPLQVAAELDGQKGMGLPDFETAVEEAQADEHLRPRMLSLPAVEFQHSGDLPGYASLVGAQRRRATAN
ncbi:uncharacterized protein E0L32_011108 [Thyridium curvatum]|uniref:Arrestin n=1 Tax=Thyridium curvatum TaxID=1093900 RepID=A0A507AIH2_9PEZI|nr:uncharacterized protein E0L32_011108 [Thyridium curvatum]TPX06963.1 hypothetical protein E0L32_011108 [Thyridium curvatum]